MVRIDLVMPYTQAISYFILCATARPDMLPTAYYDPCRNLVNNKEDAAKFRELGEALKFVEDQKIELRENCHIGVLVEDR